MRTTISLIAAGAMLLAAAPACLFAFDEPPEPVAVADIVEDVPAIVAAAAIEEFDAPPEPDTAEAWRTRRSEKDAASAEPVVPEDALEEIAPVHRPACGYPATGLPSDASCAGPSAAYDTPGFPVPPAAPAEVHEGGPMMVSPLRAEFIPLVPGCESAPGYAPVAPYAAAGSSMELMTKDLLRPAGTPVSETVELASPYIALKKQYEEFWTRKISAALDFIPGVRVSVNVEAGEHTGHVARVVRLEQEHRHEVAGAGVQRSEHLHRELDRPVVTGVCILTPDGHRTPGYHGAAHAGAEKVHSKITLAMHPGHETMFAYESQIREIVTALLPPGNEAKVIVSHYHPLPPAPAATPLAQAETAPAANAGFYMLAGIALCALIAIAVAGGIRASQIQPPPAPTATATPATEAPRQAA